MNTCRTTPRQFIVLSTLFLLLLPAVLVADTSENLQVDESVALAQYQIVNGELKLAPVPRSPYAIPQNTQANHVKLWNLVNSMIPAEMLKMHIVEFIVSTDGIDNTLASVLAVSDENNDDFTFEIDIIDSLDDSGAIRNLDDLRASIVHESAHMLTLNDSQIKITDPDQQSSATYFTDEGQTLSGAYLNLFVRKFWNGQMLEMAKDRAEMDDQDAADEALTDFFDANPGKFVSEYAATNPEEDIAESWTNFVLKQRPQGTQTADQKIAFFYDFPELVRMRTEIRRNLGL